MASFKISVFHRQDISFDLSFWNLALCFIKGWALSLWNLEFCACITCPGLPAKVAVVYPPPILEGLKLNIGWEVRPLTGNNNKWDLQQRKICHFCHRLHTGSVISIQNRVVSHRSVFLLHTEPYNNNNWSQFDRTLADRHSWRCSESVIAIDVGGFVVLKW